jgi:probable rRNA maturation factor
MGKVNFFIEEIDFSIPHPRKLATWIRKAVKSENHQLEELNYIFCSDSYLFNLNRGYLRHNTLTDIVTFDNSELEQKIEGDIFISIDRVRENSQEFKTIFDVELRRVMIHGVLHLVGYSDKSPEQKAQMRKKEDVYLSLWR